jgi:aminoglycoside phosphotransferase (APT) family kinase protein
VVLRRYVDARIFETDPKILTLEANALRLLADSEVIAPRLIAMDEHARDTDVPAMLITRLDGRIDLAPRNMQRHVERLALALPAIHAVRQTDAIPPYARYDEPEDDRVPAWTRKPDAWRAIIARAAQPPPVSPVGFIHRDYHPGNVLWSRGKVTGIIDWPNASVGPREVDVGHCRWNLAVLHGVEAADAFLDAWMHLAGTHAHDPYYDIVCLLDSGAPHRRELKGLEPKQWRDAGRTDLTARLVQQRLDAYAASLARRL